MTSITHFKTARKAAAGLLLAIGFPIVLLSGTHLADPSAGVRELSLVILTFVGLPPTTTAGWLLWGLWEQSRVERVAQAQARVDRLAATFFQLLKENNGAVTPLQFAMKAQLPGSEAKEYLEFRAQEFDAEFEVNDRGKILYLFDIPKQLSDWED
ncbi:hypothetical protein IQ235_01830 [Oscillatoriales cyanobacterium LEGE 11467]|uniref:Uncharacterized protein n=1 Tax=Zarconia navalis LEGE 11467 TaxID=1828826 RepID=A0A928Z6I5_9CYAN|nr:hypothetical protein [Zarconia navalis]MBE9039535.1 hypothetical protein [Zarconia navalis LEGE 11467]